MKEKYITLMAKALSAYTDEHIMSYFDKVKKEGLTEHGFPRLTANIGILICHGIRYDLLPLFCEMMEFCCANFHKGKAANDFSVKEVIFCIMELEKKGAVPVSYIRKWKQYLAELDPFVCYNRFARTPEDRERNWALFTGVSEFMRGYIGLADTAEFVDIQIASQLKWIDENGMYMDADVHPPMVYDLAPRGLFSVLCYFGYRGKYFDIIDGYLKKAGLLTLDMQSVTGEAPYGGRSNYFIHNEAQLALVCEYEALRYAKKGNMKLAARFKRAAGLAANNSEEWLSKTSIHHIKNRFSPELKYGCEDYAYFDKYMITAASFFYVAYLFCDDSIESADSIRPAVCRLPPHFHKLFARGNNYFLEFDTDADQHYDACGLGRIQRKDAPSAICMALPCPGEPKFELNCDKNMPLSLCSGVRYGGEWRFAADGSAKYELMSMTVGEYEIVVELICRFDDGCSVCEKYTVTDSGVRIDISANGEVAYMLPAFAFDGETYTDIMHTDSELCITYEGWQCRYIVTGSITDMNTESHSRCGYYRAFYASSNDRISINVEIMEK